MFSIISNVAFLIFVATANYFNVVKMSISSFKDVLVMLIIFTASWISLIAIILLYLNLSPSGKHPKRRERTADMITKELVISAGLYILYVFVCLIFMYS